MRQSGVLRLPEMDLLTAEPLNACEPTEPRERLRDDLRSICADGMAVSIMVGAGETYFPAFVLALGLGEVTAGLITTLPLLGGGLLQLVSPWGVRLFGSNRRWVVLCAGIQAAAFLPLMAMAVIGQATATLLFAVAAVYWGAGLASAAAWNTWIDGVVPRPVRTPFFASRTRMMQAALLGGFLFGGSLLQAGTWFGDPLAAFTVLFLLAGTCRFVSTAFLASQSEPDVRRTDRVEISLAEWFRRLLGADQGRLLLFFLLIQLGVQIAGPFFSPFMFKQLHFSYGRFMMVQATALSAKILALPLLGYYARRFGARRLLWLGGLGLVPLAASWLVSHDMRFLLVVQVFSGAAWAAYELAMLLLFFETITPRERTSVLTKFQLSSACATTIGSLIGGAIIKTLGEQPTSYYWVFSFSSLTRLGAVLLLAWPLFQVAYRRLRSSDRAAPPFFGPLAWQKA